MNKKLLLTSSSIYLSGLLFLLCPSVRSTGLSIPVDPPLGAADAKIEWQWIGIQENVATPCPMPDGGNWSVDHLFVPAHGGGNFKIPPALSPFCVYSQAHPGPVAPAELAFLLALVPEKLSALEMDSLSVTPSGEVEDALWEPLEDLFLSQVGAGPRLDPDAEPTLLVVVDTARTSHHEPYRNEGNSPHGYALLNIARTLLCQDGRCVGDIASSLAMPFWVQESEELHRVVRDPLRGGDFGSIAEVARAIQRAVAFWTAIESDSRLVINVSLGWERVFGGGEDLEDDMPLVVQAVHRAIVDARCRGALVIAAAGNSPGGPVAPGPLFPAAWEQRPGPDRLACRSALGFRPEKRFFPTPGSVYDPLVHSVAGAQADGAPLANQRSGAGARLAAFADHAVVRGAILGEPTAVLTGSSVAAIVASSAAAQIWHLLPDLRADQVMTHLYQGGDDLGRRADYGLKTSPVEPLPNVRRVSFCTAVDHACSFADWCTVSAPPCNPWDPGPIDLTWAIPEVEALEVDLSLSTEAQTLPPQCQERILWQDPVESDLEDPCPDLQYRDIAVSPWRVHPQPGPTFCPSCPLSESTSTVIVETSESDPDAVWKKPVVVVCEDSYSLGLDELRAGEVVEVTGVELDGCTEAKITATTDLGSVTSPLLILRSEETGGTEGEPVP